MTKIGGFITLWVIGFLVASPLKVSVFPVDCFFFFTCTLSYSCDFLSCICCLLLLDSCKTNRETPFFSGLLLDRASSCR